MSVYLSIFLHIFIYAISCLHCFAQDRTTVTVNQNNRIFSISIDNKDYFIGDTVVVDFEIYNASDEPFFIIDFDYWDIDSQVTVNNENSSLFEEIQGRYTFMPEHYEEFWKLKLIEPGRTINYKIRIDSHDVIIQHAGQRWHFGMEMGYFNYSDGLLYLTEGEEPDIVIRDAWEITRNYNLAVIRALPIHFYQRNPP